MDELLQELRSLGVGCYVADMYFGAVRFCDDILLLAPTRDGMQMMPKTCESFALRNNLQFSTDPNPAKSKSKCIFMIGKKKNLPKPAPLILSGKELPWVATATHLGHELMRVGTWIMMLVSRELSSSGRVVTSERHFLLLALWRC